VLPANEQLAAAGAIILSARSCVRVAANGQRRSRRACAAKYPRSRARIRRIGGRWQPAPICAAWRSRSRARPRDRTLTKRRSRSRASTSLSLPMAAPQTSSSRPTNSNSSAWWRRTPLRRYRMPGAGKVGPRPPCPAVELKSALETAWAHAQKKRRRRW